MTSVWSSARLLVWRLPWAALTRHLPLRTYPRCEQGHSMAAPSSMTARRAKHARPQILAATIYHRCASSEAPRIVSGCGWSPRSNMHRDVDHTADARGCAKGGALRSACWVVCGSARWSGVAVWAQGGAMDAQCSLVIRQRVPWHPRGGSDLELGRHADRVPARVSRQPYGHLVMP